MPVFNSPRHALASVSDVPTSDAGTNQQQAGLGLVTLNGSASTNYDSLAWTMVKITTAGFSDATSLLSSTTVAGPTFTPDAAGDTYIAVLTATKGSNTDTSQVTIYIDAAASGDAWVTLDPSTAEWSSDPGTMLDAGASTLGETSTIALNGVHGALDAGRDALVWGWQYAASYDFITSATGIVFEITANKPSSSGGSSDVEVGAFCTNLQDQTGFGYRGGIKWNGARTVTRGVVGPFGAYASNMGDFGNAADPVKVYLWMPFWSDRPGRRPNIYGSNNGIDEAMAQVASALVAFTNLEIGIYLENRSAVVATWTGVQVRYKVISQ